MKRFCLSLFVIMSCGHVYAATDPSKPYIGSQTPDSSDGLNNGAIQGFSSWGADVTGEMGNTLGYITPSNTANAGGVWAGDKAAALTFGNPKTGIFVDDSGAKIKNSDLDLTDNKVTNLKDGVADKDAVNVSQLKKSADETLNSANSYTDGKARETLNAANHYTDGKSRETLDTANHYADGKAKETLDTATTYTDNKSREMLGTANAYTDQKIERLDKKMNRGLASTAALSGLFQPYGIGKFNLSAGVGGYRSESAVAVGSGYRFTENVAAKAGISTSVGDSASVMYNASVNLEW